MKAKWEGEMKNQWEMGWWSMVRSMEGEKMSDWGIRREERGERREKRKKENNNNNNNNNNGNNNNNNKIKVIVIK